MITAIYREREKKSNAEKKCRWFFFRLVAVFVHRLQEAVYHLWFCVCLLPPFAPLAIDFITEVKCYRFKYMDLRFYVVHNKRFVMCNVRKCVRAIICMGCRIGVWHSNSIESHNNVPVQSLQSFIFICKWTKHFSQCIDCGHSHLIFECNA